MISFISDLCLTDSSFRLLYISDEMAKTDESETTDLLIALSHPLRRQVLRKLSDGKPHSPSRLAKGLDAPLPTLSYHVRVLADRGAVRLVRTAPARGSTQHFYRSTVEAEWARSVLESSERPQRRRRRFSRGRPKKKPRGEKPADV